MDEALKCPAKRFVKAIYSRFSGRVPVKVGLTLGFGAVYPLVFEDNAGIPIGLIGCAWNQGQDPDLVQIYHISSFRPSHGAGTKMMTAMCDLADTHSVRLYVQAEPLDSGGNEPMDQVALVGWYRRFGFAGQVALVRLPSAA